MLANRKAVMVVARKTCATKKSRNNPKGVKNESGDRLAAVLAQEAAIRLYC